MAFWCITDLLGGLSACMSLCWLKPSAKCGQGELGESVTLTSTMYLMGLYICSNILLGFQYPHSTSLSELHLASDSYPVTVQPTPPPPQCCHILCCVDQLRNLPISPVYSINSEKVRAVWALATLVGFGHPIDDIRRAAVFIVIAYRQYVQLQFA